MPITDPKFQHSDEDWTQITQPRLRKRVQNRVSQRKHRSKIRQQRANSVEAERAVSVSKGTREHSLHHGSISSNSSSNPGGQQHGQQDYDISKQVFAEPDHLQPWTATEGLAYSAFEDPPYAETHKPWLEYPSSSYPVSSAYPVGSPSFGIPHAQVSNSYDLAQTTRSIARPFSSSASPAPPMNSTMIAQHEPQQHSYYTTPTSVSHGQYLTTAESTGFPLQERMYERSPNTWNPSTAHYSGPKFDSGSMDSGHTRESSFGPGYYDSLSMSRANNVSSTATSPAPVPGSRSYSSYDRDLLSPPASISTRSRGSGIDSHRYKSSNTTHLSYSVPKEKNRSRYPSH
ncbi:MAG: hypothetical protein LQ339_005688 [Xanthoria mediterranea]|nr:MAG: hypothetical protein LQ339_005688 [Xanthoria mediterranea]